MSAENKKCTCELCQANWFLDEEADQFQPQPTAQRTAQPVPEKTDWLKQLWAEREALVMANG